MENIDTKLAEASKEELIQVLSAVCGSHATTRGEVESILAYIDEQKSKKKDKAAHDVKRRSSRPSTRASSDAFKDLLRHRHHLHLHSRHPHDHHQVVKVVRPIETVTKRDIKICQTCSKPFEEKNNTETSCSHHPGHWLIELEDDEDHIGFVSESKAEDEIKNNPALPWILSCCCIVMENGVGEGCVKAKHVALAAEGEGKSTDVAAVNKSTASK